MKQSSKHSIFEGLRGLLHLAYYAMVPSLVMMAMSCSDNDPTQVPIDTGVLSATKTDVVLNFDTPVEEAITFSWHAERSPSIEYQLVFSANSKTDTVSASTEVIKKFNHAQLNKILVDELQLEIGKAASVDVSVLGKVKGNGNTGSSNVIAITVTPSQKVPEPPLDKVVLSALRSALVINLANPAGEAVAFLWAVERNPFIEYTLTLSAGTKSASIDVLSDVSKEFTNAELNTILLDKLQLPSGKTSEVNVQSTARITVSGRTVSSNTVAITVTPASKDIAPPAYTKLWIVGDATPVGWNIGSPNVMTNDPVNLYQFKFNSILNAGEFKIPVATGNWNGDFYMPPVNNPDMESTAVKLILQGNPDNKWKITSAGAYKVLLNIGANPFIKITPFVPVKNIYLVGDATTAGWDTDNPIEMIVNPGDPNEFTWTGPLKSGGRGQFRFPLSKGNANDSFYAAPSAGAGIASTQLSFTSGDMSPNNFRVKEGEDGIYKITINQLSETVSVVKQ